MSCGEQFFELWALSDGGSEELGVATRTLAEARELAYRFLRRSERHRFVDIHQAGEPVERVGRTYTRRVV